MRWNSSGSSAGGRSAYFSARRIIVSWTMSSAASSSRTAYTARFQARFSTLLRKSESSLSVAKEGRPNVRSSKRPRLSHRTFGRRAGAGSGDSLCDNSRLHDSFDRRHEPDRGAEQGIVLKAPHPPHEGEGRCTDGFSSEKFTEVKESWK